LPPAAFSSFPDREYCVLTLPHSSADTALLSKFVLVEPCVGSTFEHVLYVLHRAALLCPADIRVRPAAPRDKGTLLNMSAPTPSPAFLQALHDAVASHGALPLSCRVCVCVCGAVSRDCSADTATLLRCC
jgi:hypothetical protein